MPAHPQFFLHAPSHLSLPATRMIQKTTNNCKTMRIIGKRGFNRPLRFHVIESLSGGSVIYNAPIGLDLSGNFSKGSLRVHACNLEIVHPDTL